MTKKRVSAEVRKLFMNGKTVQGCFPTGMVKKVGLSRGGQVLMIQKLRGSDIALKDGDIIVRAVGLLVDEE